MAAVTRTAASAAPAVQPRGNHRSVDAVGCEISHVATATSSAGVILLGKVPNGSTVVGLVGGGATAANVDMPITYSLNGVTLGSATALAVGPLTLAGTPATLSLTDGAVPQYAYLTGTVGTIVSATALGTLKVTMLLTRDV
jgi:hypothetical protein